MFRIKKELEELKFKIKLFEDITDQSFNSWLNSLGNLEHQYHSKLSDLEKREERIKAKEELLEKTVEAEKVKARGDYEEKYYHELHTNITTLNEKNLEVMKSFAEAIKGNRVEIINNK